MSKTFLPRFSIAGVAAALALTACSNLTPDDPDASSPAVATSPVTQAEQDPTTREYDVDDVRAVFENLPPEGSFEWDGGLSVTHPKNSQSGWDDYSTEPAACNVFWHMRLQDFPDDLTAAPDDVVLATRLVDKKGPGPEDNEWLATVNVRIIADRADSHVDAVASILDATDECADGYETTDHSLGWSMIHVQSQEVLAPAEGLPPEPASVTVSAISAERPDAGEAWDSWFVVDNLFVHVVQEVGTPDRPETDAERARALLRVVATAFDEYWGDA